MTHFLCGSCSQRAHAEGLRCATHRQLANHAHVALALIGQIATIPLPNCRREDSGRPVVVVMGTVGTVLGMVPIFVLNLKDLELGEVGPGIER